MISDGEECLKRLATMLPQPATHILDWFLISMKLQPLAQMALTAPEGHGLFEQDIDRIKWRLWNGQPKRALDLATAVRAKFSSEIGHCLWARRADKLLQKLTTYIGRNSGSVINYAKRHRAGQRIATSPAEASVNSLVAKRFVKKQQMRWSRTGAHYLLKVRAAMLNGNLSERMPKHKQAGQTTVLTKKPRISPQKHLQCRSHPQTPLWHCAAFGKMGSTGTFAALVMGGRFGKERRSLHRVRTSKTRTKRSLPFRVFADAASARMCGSDFAATQPMSSERSLPSGIDGLVDFVLLSVQTVLSPHVAFTRKTRIFWSFATFMPRSAELE